MRFAQFVFVFASVFIAGLGFLRTSPARPAIGALSESFVSASAWLIHGCGGSATAEGAVLRDPLSGFAIEMKDGCNGVNVTMLLWAALLAFPASWIQKIKGLAAGTLAIQIVNFARFVSLFYLGKYSLAWFDFAHHYVWESLIVLDTLVVFWIWVQLVFRSRATLNAGH